MVNRTLSACLVASFLSLQCLPGPALADNQMGYQLLPANQASVLPRNGGKLGLSVGRAQQINSQGLTFDLLRVNGVTSNSPGANAGFRVGDQIIAVDGKVFPSVAAFASYIGSIQPAQQISIDYMPSQSGPQEAQRINVTLGGSSSQSIQPSQPAPAGQPASTGLSTGTKVAIGIGAAALFGCYKMGCFSHRAKAGYPPKPASATQTSN